MSKLPANFPARWVICQECDGEGKSCSHLGDFSMEELNHDPDFKADYFSGRYDRACRECGGSGKTREVIVERCTFGQKRHLVSMRRDAVWRAESDAECAAEIRMGA